MEALYHIFGYLKHHDHSTMVFDDAYFDWKDSDFHSYDWSEFYRDATEELPRNALLPRVMPLQITVFVDASHVCNTLYRNLHVGKLI